MTAKNIVIVETYDAKTRELETTKSIDYSKSSQRGWLGRHSQWALNNGKAVVTYQESAQQAK